MPAAGTNTRTSVLSALDYHTGTLTSLLAGRASSVEFQEFMELLCATYPEQHLHVVMDNASYHKSTVMQRWFRTHQDRMTVILLPPYSPELNLIERVFRFLKHQLACHRFWNDLAALQTRTQDLLDHIIAEFHRPETGGVRLCQNLSRSA